MASAQLAGQRQPTHGRDQRKQERATQVRLVSSVDVVRSGLWFLFFFLGFGYFCLDILKCLDIFVWIFLIGFFCLGSCCVTFLQVPVGRLP